MRISVILLILITGGFGLATSSYTGKTNHRHIRVKSAPADSADQVISLASGQLGVHAVINGLDVPWDIAWGPDNYIWFTEQGGRISKLDPVTGKRKVLLTIPDVFRKRTSGLLGLALHPDMKNFPYIFVDYTVKNEKGISSRLVRYTYHADMLTDPLILQEVPANDGHNGSRVAVSPDGKVFWTTGDAQHEEQAQDWHFLNGKILRFNIDGSIPADNPVKGSPIWSCGYRNMQGIVCASNGKMYTSEHGDANDDEVNLIRRGGNYGFPNVTGFCDQPKEKEYCAKNNIIEPLKAWTPTIAPSGIDYYHSDVIPEWKNAILLVTLKENDLRVLKLNASGTAIVSETIFLDRVYGRLRDVCVSPAGDVYLATSNRDWNPGPGFPKAEDDQILRIFKMKGTQTVVKASVKAAPIAKTLPTNTDAGAVLFNQYCASCHKADGKGLAGTFPPLSGSAWVKGDKKVLLRTVLSGLSGTIQVSGKEYNQQMPAFNFLNNKQLASVLSYIRTHFGNRASPVTQAEVQATRARIK